MTNRPESEITALRKLGEEFDRLAAVQPPRQAMDLWAKLALAVAALLAVTGLSLTPPGRAIAEEIGELVGIGDPATLPPDDRGPSLVERGQPVVIASGRAPDGSPYEVVANRSVTHHPTHSPVRFPDGPVTCMTVDLLEAPSVHGIEVCVGQGDQGLLGRTGYLDGVNFIDRRVYLDEGDDYGPEARYMLTAEVSPDITRVEVTYREAGDRVEAYSDVGQVDAEIAALLGTDDRVGYIVAFLPDDRLPPGWTVHAPEHRQDPGVLGTIELVGINEAGEAVAQDHFGERITQQLEADNRRLQAQQTMEERVLAALEAGTLDVPLCVEALRATVRDPARDACFDVLASEEGGSGERK
jgi:hypothetical protein